MHAICILFLLIQFAIWKDGSRGWREKWIFLAKQIFLVHRSVSKKLVTCPGIATLLISLSRYYELLTNVWWRYEWRQVSPSFAPTNLLITAYKPSIDSKRGTRRVFGIYSLRAIQSLLGAFHREISFSKISFSNSRRGTQFEPKQLAQASRMPRKIFTSSNVSRV